MANKQVSLESRKTVLDRTKGHCAYCGKILHMEDQNWVIDHIWPAAQYGSNNDTNFFAACPRCNQRKGNRTPAQFKEAILRQTEEYLRKAEQLSDGFLILPVGFQGDLNNLIYRIRNATVMFAFEDYTTGEPRTAEEELERIRKIARGEPLPEDPLVVML